MNYLHPTIILAFVLFAAPIFAQPIGCLTRGEVAEKIVPRLKANLEIIKNGAFIEQRSTTYVPVKFHLVAKNDGQGRLPYRLVLDQLCELNEDFAPLDIQFFISENVNYLDNTGIYNDHFAAQNLMNLYREPSAINVYIIQDIDPSDAAARGYYSPSLDWIVIENQEIGSGRSLTHEVGHFFSLLHPFHGWDNDPYSPEKHGIPAPSEAPLGVPTEKMDGSNCDEAGDLLCDTPADFAFNYPWPDCQFDAEVLDPNSVPIDPDEKLFMNYFDCPRDDYYFTEQQVEAMQVDVARRVDLKKNKPFQSSIIRTKATLIFPTGGMELDQSTTAEFFWTEISGADRYLVEIDNSPTFSGDDVITRVVQSNRYFAQNLIPGQTYYWRVRPFNLYYSCVGFSSFSAFKTKSDQTVSTVSTLSQVNSFELFPNPITNQQLSIRLTLESPLEGYWQILNANGQVLQKASNTQLSIGAHQLKLPLNPMIQKGIYWLQWVSPEGIMTAKFLKTD